MSDLVTVALMLTPAEVGALRSVLDYCGRVTVPPSETTAALSEIERTDLALRAAVLGRAMQRASVANEGEA